LEIVDHFAYSLTLYSLLSQRVTVGSCRMAPFYTTRQRCSGNQHWKIRAGSRRSRNLRAAIKPHNPACYNWMLARSTLSFHWGDKSRGYTSSGGLPIGQRKRADYAI